MHWYSMHWQSMHNCCNGISLHAQLHLHVTNVFWQCAHSIETVGTSAPHGLHVMRLGQPETCARVQIPPMLLGTNIFRLNYGFARMIKNTTRHIKLFSIGNWCTPF